MAEGSTQLTHPWTFQDLSGLINKGEFDDEVMTYRQQLEDARKSRSSWEEQQRSHRQKRSFEQTEGVPLATGQEASSSTRVRHEPEGLGDAPPGDVDSRHSVQEDLDVDKLLDDPDYLPFQAPEPAPLLRHPLFLKARRRHEMDDRPPHVKRQEFLDNERGPQGSPKDDVDEVMFLENMDANANFLNQVEQYAFAVTLPTPETEAEWRAIVKDPSKFVAKKLAKGVEVSWQKLNEQQRSAMSEAKQIEISEWVSSKVCQAAVGPVPRDRLMKMRWVLVFQTTNDPSVVKAKARLVVVGFTDPDLRMESVRSPTLTRRGRQCLLQMSLHKGWKTLKSDAKAAFLQTGDTQKRRQVFGMPVNELREAMGLKHNQAVQFLKAAYGITVAPREFYQHVDGILRHLGLQRLHVDPSIWVLKTHNEQTGKMEVLGAVGAHVDDFLLMGDEDSPRWNTFLEDFYKSLKWSPWECPPMMRCGVQMVQDGHQAWHLSQDEFCEGINQAIEDGNGKDLTANEMHQCRAILGAAQWRCYQTAPQHCAKLSHLQSLLPKGDRNTLKDVNKFVRELYHMKSEKISVYDLKAQNDEDTLAVGWSDAALANRVDLTSTGGYVIGFVHKSMLDGHQGPVSLVSWSTHKLRRVCRSSLAAEAQALAECESELFLVRTLWQELLGASIILKNPWETSKQTPAALVIDAKALYDMLKQEDLTNLSAKEKHTALEVMGLSQHLVEQSTTLRWVNSLQQLADSMTKLSAADSLVQFLKKGQRWNLAFDETFTAAKKLKSANAAGVDVQEAKDPTWLELLSQTSGHVRNPAID